MATGVNPARQMKIKKFDNAEKFWTEALEVVMQAHSERDQGFRLAMSGGSAANLLAQLQTHNFDWSGTTLFQVDERFVPTDHPDSNARLLNEKLGKAEVKTQYFPILESREASLKVYQKQLQPDQDGYLFDLTVLGVGSDGHTASLFPHTSALESAEVVVATETDVFAVRERLSLGFAAIAQSRHILVLMMGAGKAEILEKIQDPATDYKDCPARKILELPQAKILWCNY